MRTWQLRRFVICIFGLFWWNYSIPLRQSDHNYKLCFTLYVSHFFREQKTLQRCTFVDNGNANKPQECPNCTQLQSAAAAKNLANSGKIDRDFFPRFSLPSVLKVRDGWNNGESGAFFVYFRGKILDALSKWEEAEEEETIFAVMSAMRNGKRSNRRHHHHSFILFPTFLFTLVAT